jgi:hypothetical protein
MVQSLQRRWGDKGGFLIHRLKDRSHYSIDIIHHVIIPEAQDAVTQNLEVRCAVGVIVLLFEVLTPVQLNDEHLARAAEVGNVLSDGVLTAEAEAIRPVAAQKGP